MLPFRSVSYFYFAGVRRRPFVSTYLVVNDPEIRARHSGPGIRGFLRVSAVWALSGPERMTLLGGGRTRATLRNWERGTTRVVLSADELMRVSLVLAIHEELERLWRHAPGLADTWLRRPRPEPPFRGMTPLDFMLAGGIPALLATRQYVDALAGGPPSRSDYPQPPRAVARGLAAGSD